MDLECDLVPDGLWEIAAPLIPPFKPRREGGGTAPVSDRKVFCAIVYALITSCAWRRVPTRVGMPPPNGAAGPTLRGTSPAQQ
ncbi:transposase [Streptomyces sp. NPDC006326]|uniref:transposase n=1 Tax=Streptomyces sp. NPDC006326 TaxID=3156752 RepID=UPI0033B952C3